ncbi:RNA polymerase sigma-70 factor (ECF subfamily) [Catenuloplanes nepalensis]|uniref:RNA polymerase sigma-70 factor (ECF subfamily) n=1 Tax=Catenuloplanes nepalensis TaxID=587533 RepID=A0ABT9MSU5_9ACTN|nr:sigma-70 family RNA polymerase sigma factor [Catenuloplanes nepalensis]MDP9794510.1 RNA polymerase sigma-70 factor (ECF subfamily) [Catenuloplanes nepalensis]
MEADGDLARAARDGDVAAFAALAERHRAAMRVTAIGELGYTDEVDDAVQDAMISAFRQVASLREPEAAGAWLRAITRNVCRMRVRTRIPAPVADPEPWMSPAEGPDELLDRAGTRDWVWHAIARLSDPIREVMLLRYFTGMSSYAQISQLCGIGVDTVGSRLRDGRRILALTLRETAGAAFEAADAEAAALRREAEQHFAVIHTGGYDRIIDDWFRPDFSVVFMGWLHGDRAAAREMIDRTMGAGVTATLHDAVGSRNVVLWEGDFHNPSSDPDHCPPRFAWLLRMREGRVARLGVAYGQTPRV